MAQEGRVSWGGSGGRRPSWVDRFARAHWEVEREPYPWASARKTTVLRVVVLATTPRRAIQGPGIVGRWLRAGPRGRARGSSRRLLRPHDDLDLGLEALRHRADRRAHLVDPVVADQAEDQAVRDLELVAVLAELDEPGVAVANREDHEALPRFPLAAQDRERLRPHALRAGHDRVRRPRGPLGLLRDRKSTRLNS